MKNVLAVRELANKRGRTLRLTVGRVIGADELLGFSDDERATAFLRQKTEALAAR
jgi:hypothetical protein